MDVKKIMLLENDKSFQILLKEQILKYAPSSILTVADRKSNFLKKINWFFPDLILADFNLLDYSGLEALLYVREHKPYIPFVFVTNEICHNDKISKKVLEVADGSFFKNDMDNLHIELKKIMEIKAAKAHKGAECMRRQYQLKLTIEKTIHLLEASESFSKKEKVLSLLKNLDIGMEDEKIKKN